MSDTREKSDPGPAAEIRIGIGTDRHRLEEDRPLVLCGLSIPSPHGPIAHSDGDVILHALCDALLGASGSEDIGALFPDTDPQWQGIESQHLLVEVLRIVADKGWKPKNVDVVVHLERPRLLEYRDSMRQQLAAWLGIPEDAVGLKAKTGEGVGLVGESLVIESMAVVQLVSQEV
ncbi:MAG: 2-C-methyl-D-erythritol 2,4-cyclodiphosphate synthase [Planctomycetota bacterium]